VEFTPNVDNNMACSINNPKLLNNFTELLGADYSNVVDTLLFKKLVIGKSTISSPLKSAECQNAKNGLAKNLYEALFDYIV
jgi:myosin heavy subunit